MFYAIAYTATSDSRTENVVLSDLTREGVADMFDYLSNLNCEGTWFVREASLYTMSGEYVGNPSYLSFAPQAMAYRREPVA